ncbi:hypothetical protein N9051_00990 [Akkermansiaceae bacterium]|nr:hypothetical protein [Akkermansiaceae bacterium]
MNSPDNPWKKLVQATKSLEEEPVTPTPEVNVSSLRERVQVLMLTLTWRKLSLVAALLAGVFFLIFFLFMRDDHHPQEPIIQPEPPTNPDAP